MSATMRPLTARFFYELSWRGATELLLRRLSGRGRKARDPDLLLVALAPAALIVMSACVVTIGWWLLTGRGPGAKLIELNIGGPRTRPPGFAPDRTRAPNRAGANTHTVQPEIRKERTEHGWLVATFWPNGERGVDSPFFASEAQADEFQARVTKLFAGADRRASRWRWLWSRLG